jgi:polar amino acid transport system permease protein
MDTAEPSEPRHPPPAKRSGPFRLTDAFLFGLLILLLALFMARGTENLGYNWQWYRVPQYLFTLDEQGFEPGPLLEGLGVTLEITGISLVLAFVFGLTAALFRISDSFAARWIARGYVETIRNTPLLVQLFFIYFVLGPILDIDRMTSAVLALSLFEGAYASEILRSGIESVEKTQWEAAYSIGLHSPGAFRLVIFPQALRRVLPPLTSQAVSLLKDSALVSTIAVFDLTMRGRAIISETYLTFELWFTVAAIYLSIALILSALVSVVRKRMDVKT